MLSNESAIKTVYKSPPQSPTTDIAANMDNAEDRRAMLSTALSPGSPEKAPPPTDMNEDLDHQHRRGQRQAPEHDAEDVPRRRMPIIKCVSQRLKRSPCRTFSSAARL